MERYDEYVAQRYLLRQSGALKEYFFSQENRHVFEGLDVSGKTVLDLGCGVGRLEPDLDSMGAKQIIACDISFPMLRLATTKNSCGSATFLVADAARLPLTTASVDTAVSLGLFEGVADLAPFVREVRRVLRPGGQFVLSFWNAQRWYRLGVLDGRRPGSVDHPVSSVRAMLKEEGYDVVSVRSALFLPRRLFWGIYYLLFMEPLRLWFVRLCNWVARRLERSSVFRGRGWVAILRCRKIHRAAETSQASVEAV